MESDILAGHIQIPQKAPRRMIQAKILHVSHDKPPPLEVATVVVVIVKADDGKVETLVRSTGNGKDSLADACAAAIVDLVELSPELMQELINKRLAKWGIQPNPNLN